MCRKNQELCLKKLLEQTSHATRIYCTRRCSVCCDNFQTALQTLHFLCGNRKILSVLPVGLGNYCKQFNHQNSRAMTAMLRAILSEKSFQSAATILLRNDARWVRGWRRASAGARPATADTWSRLRGASYRATKSSADAARTTSTASAAHLRVIFAVLYAQGAG